VPVGGAGNGPTGPDSGPGEPRPGRSIPEGRPDGVRLGVVVPTFPTGVTSSELWLAKGLTALGHEVVVFSSSRAGARDRGWREGSSSVGVGSTSFPVHRLSTMAIGYAEAAVPLEVSEVFRERLDACLLAEDYPPLSQFVARGARSRGIPYMVTSERYESAGPLLPRIGMRVLNRTLLPRMWSAALALTFHSRAALRYFARLGAPGDRMHYIPSCTDTRLFTPAAGRSNGPAEGLWATDPSHVRILSVARLHPAKGLDVLARAMARLRTTAPDAVAVIHGRGGAEAELRAQIVELGLGTSLRLDPSSVDLEVLPEIYRSADIYVQPSRTEPFGMAVLEAMACGRPVVASSTGGLEDLVEDGTTGFLVPPGDVEALSGALRTLVADPGLRDRMGRAARLRAESLFEMRAVTQSYSDLLAAAVPRAG
jgi:glycosyltransferase involved in cell wall biosynthesis